jgi:hypothetical protein
MYRVYWGPEIIAKISKAYAGLSEVDREQLMIAIEALDARLLDNPIAMGESRDSPYIRIATEHPLTVTFRIDQKEQAVRVSGVSYFRRKN